MCENAFNKIERDIRAEDGTALNFMARITLWSSEVTFVGTSGLRPNRTVTLITTPLATATTSSNTSIVSYSRTSPHSGSPP